MKVLFFGSNLARSYKLWLGLALLVGSIFFLVSAQTTGEITIAHDLPYVEEGDARQALDIYIPPNPDNFPVLILVSGGGWTRGDRTWMAGLAEAIAPTGIGVVTVDHRLQPKVTTAQQVQDLALAVAWVKTHIADYGGDPQRIMIGGHSAGGHLVALLSMNPSYLEEVGYSPSDLLGVISLSGALDMPSRFEPEFLPTTYIQADLPPMLLLVAENDQPDFAQMAQDFQTNLSAVEVAATYALIPEADHFDILENATTQRIMLTWMSALLDQAE